MGHCYRQVFQYLSLVYFDVHIINGLSCNGDHTVQKYVLRIIDHSMIYVAISGTYTPILLNVVGGWLGWTVFILLWGQLCGDFI